MARFTNLVSAYSNYSQFDWMSTIQYDKLKTQNTMKTVTLNNGTILKEGKKYRKKDWIQDDYIEVRYIDEGVDTIYTVTNNGIPVIHYLHKDWLPYTAPQEEVKWKTFLIEHEYYRTIEQYKTIEDVKFKFPNESAVKITEVEIEIKEK